MRTSTISSHYVRASIAGAVAQGHNAHDLLDKAGIAREILLEPKARIYPDKMAKLLRIIAHTLKDEFLGHDDKPSVHGSFETLCQLILPCGTLREALTLGTQYYKLFDMSLHTEFLETQEHGFLVSNQHRPLFESTALLSGISVTTMASPILLANGQHIPIKC